MHTHGRAPRRIMLIAVSGVVVVLGAVVTPQAFAGTLPGLGRGGAGLFARGGATGAQDGAGKDGTGKDGASKAAGRGPLGGLGALGRGAGANGPGRGAGGLGGLGRGAGGLGNGAGGLGNGAGAADDSAEGGSCSDVELVFARGTGEPQGLGIVGQPLLGALADELPDADVGSFAVVYDAAANQASAGPGATNMSQHIVAAAEKCPDMTFVIGGYSQGASVTDIAIGIQDAGTPGEAIPAELEPRVAAVLAFGNPLGLRRQTIADSSPEFGPKSKEFCNQGDPVCGNGNNFLAHIQYPRNGSVEEAAAFAAGKVDGS